MVKKLEKILGSVSILSASANSALASGGVYHENIASGRVGGGDVLLFLGALAAAPVVCAGLYYLAKGIGKVYQKLPDIHSERSRDPFHPDPNYRAPPPDL